ncbi:MAG: ComEA family DNA-binding protein [Vibrionaceae bacterium]
MLKSLTFAGLAAALIVPLSFASQEMAPSVPQVQEQAVKININTADAAEIDQKLIGVGEKKAQAIIEYRKQHGKFGSIDALDQVKGFGPELIEKNRDRIEL